MRHADHSMQRAFAAAFSPRPLASWRPFPRWTGRALGSSALEPPSTALPPLESRHDTRHVGNRRTSFKRRVVTRSEQKRRLTSWRRDEKVTRRGSLGKKEGNHAQLRWRDRTRSPMSPPIAPGAPSDPLYVLALAVLLLLPRAALAQSCVCANSICCTSESEPCLCDNGGLCMTDPTPLECGSRFCGTFGDTCGNEVTCGNCTTSGEVCCTNPAGCELNTCCTPTTCAARGVNCGSIVNCQGTLDCGSCPSGQTCTAAQQCCTLTTSAAQGARCGSVSDGCGGELACGSCPSGFVCNASNQCGTSVPASTSASTSTLFAILLLFGGLAVTKMRHRLRR